MSTETDVTAGRARVSRFLPLVYAAQCKRNPQAGLPFFADNLGDDLVIVLLAFLSVSAPSAWASLGIIVLHFSFWSIYEVGYHENDRIAATLEKDGNVPGSFRVYGPAFSLISAWAWGLGLGAAGVYALRASHDAYSYAGLSRLLGLPVSETTAFWLSLGAWGALLVVLRLCYWGYNHIDKMTRQLAYVPLQILKYGFPILLLPLPPAGAALIMAQLLRRWIPYIVYRNSKISTGRFPARVIRLTAYLLLVMLLAPSNWTLDFALHAAICAVVLLARSLSQIRDIYRSAHGVSADKWTSARKADK